MIDIKEKENKPPKFRVLVKREDKEIWLGTYADEAIAKRVDALSKNWQKSGSITWESGFEALLPALGELFKAGGLKDISREDYERYTSELRDCFSGGNVQQLLAALKEPRSLAHESEIAPERQRRLDLWLARMARSMGLCVPPRPKKERSELPDSEDVSKLVEEALKDKGSWLAVATLLISGLGLRSNELFALRWMDVDLDYDAIVVRNALTSRSEEVSPLPAPLPAFQCRCLLFCEAASGRGNELKTELKRYAARKEGRPVSARLDDFLFPSLGPSTLNAAFRRPEVVVGVHPQNLQPRLIRYHAGRTRWLELYEKGMTPEECDDYVRRFLGLSSRRDLRRNLGIGIGPDES